MEFIDLATSAIIALYYKVIPASKFPNLIPVSSDQVTFVLQWSSPH